jgi:hypothetical protein
LWEITGEATKPASISLLTIALAFLLDLVAIRFAVGDRSLSFADLAFTYGVFGLEYELVLVSFGLLLAATFSSVPRDRGRLSPAWAITFISFILGLGFNAMWPQPINWFTIALPDIVGVVTIVWSVHAVRGA